MEKIYLYLFAFVTIWAITMTIFCFYRNPLPFPDKGHRCFAVPDENAAKILLKILDEVGLKELFTFDAGSTHQTLLSDNTTVIIRHNGCPLPEPNGFSVVVEDPQQSGLKAADILEEAGFSTKADHMLGMEGKIFILESDAFEGWVLVFRKHILKMGKISNKRRLSS